MNNLQYQYECRDGLCYLIENPKQQYQGSNESIEETTTSISLPQKHDEWTIYGTDYCGFCSKAKEQLDSMKIPYVYHTVTSQSRTELGELTDNYSYVPMIFNRDKFIGGFTDLCTHLKDSPVMENK